MQAGGALDEFETIRLAITRLAADASADDAAFMRDSQVPIRMSAFGQKLTAAAWRSRPSWARSATPASAR